MILGLLKLWMSSKAPLMDMDPPHPCPNETYYDLLINGCVRYDKTKKANIGKRRNVYATNIDETYVDLPTACIDDVPDSPYGGIDLPPDEFYQVHALSSRHPPPQRPGQPTRPPFRPQCWKPSSPFSNVNFRNTTIIAAQLLCS